MKPARVLLHVGVDCFVFLLLAQFPQGEGPTCAGMRDINARVGQR